MKLDEAQVTPRCPIRTTLDLLGGKWKLLILFQLNESSKRFSELLKVIPEISEKMLYQELQTLEENHLILKSLSEIDGITRYLITDIGRESIPLIHSMKQFSDKYTDFLSSDM